MRRAAIFMADAARGGCGRWRPRHLVPAARRTAAHAGRHADRPAGAVRGRGRGRLRGRRAAWSRPEYADVLGITTLVCTPMSAAGRAYGVICADRGGGRVRAHRRRAPSAVDARQDGGARRHGAPRDAPAGAQPPAVRAARARARDPRARAPAAVRRLARAQRHAAARAESSGSAAGVEIQEAIGELRRALERPLAPLPRETGTTLAEELERLRGEPGIPVRVDVGPAAEVSPSARPTRPVGARRGPSQRHQARRRRPRSR